MPELATALRAGPPLAMEALGYRYPRARGSALRNVTVELRRGELVVVCGRSGSGKSTLLQAACGLVPHFHGGEVSGRVLICGRDTREAGPGELAGAVGFVAQDPETQVVSTTVGAEIELPLELRGSPPPARARAVEEVALALAIPHLLPRAVDTLSGGELQRVALAAALVTRPELVLLDEPTSQLDPVAGDELIWLLRRLNEEWGVTVLLAEHRLERCLAAADRVIAMDAGTLSFDGPPRDFLAWALRHDPVLATPGARLFSLAGISPLPVGVRDAREILESRDDRGGLRQPPAGRSHERSEKASPALVARDLWVELDRGDAVSDALKGIELEIGAGERVALMGRNGAGKSTLMRTAAGLLAPVRGRIDAPRGCALLSQNPGDFLVRERVGDELPGDEGRATLEAVGLGEMADADPRDLSGGERQRLALAITLAGRGGGDLPGLVCLDEPTRGMDRGRKAELTELIGELATGGAAVLVATHDVEFADAFSERVVLLGDGEVIADAPAGEVLSGGWYFATEVARILGLEGVTSAEQGAELIGGPM